MEFAFQAPTWRRLDGVLEDYWSAVGRVQRLDLAMRAGWAGPLTREDLAKLKAAAEAVVVRSEYVLGYTWEGWSMYGGRRSGE